MNVFLQKYASDVIGILSGFDRLVVRGHIRQLAYSDGMKCYMAINRVRTVDFKTHVQKVTTQLKEAVEAPVRRDKRLIKYLPSTKTNKEKLVQEVVAKDGIREGTICLLSCVEPCRTFDVHREPKKKSLDVRSTFGKCTFLYKYSFHPELGYIHARIQSWFPFSVQIYINGREWLSRQLDQAGLGYRRVDNSFIWLEDLDAAQQLMDKQLQTNWPQLLDEILEELNPLYPAMFGNFHSPYYWSTYQMEWATDVMFSSPEALTRIYRALPRHAIDTLSCVDVLRYLGHKRPIVFAGDARGKLTRRVEGVRVKHAANGNSLKVYDKAYADSPTDWSVLRLENTTNNPKGYRAYRPTEGKPDGPKRWLPLRKGVADLHRLTKVAQSANDRYAEALVACDNSQPFAQKMFKLTARATLNGRWVRGLRPYTVDDLALLRAVNRGEGAINGLRNRELRGFLYDKPANEKKEQLRRSARVGRLLRMLRAHGIIRKVPRTHRYQVTARGRDALAAVLIVANTTAAQLTKLAT